jgi:hypothetical protein
MCSLSRLYPKSDYIVISWHTMGRMTSRHHLEGYRCHSKFGQISKKGIFDLILEDFPLLGIYKFDLSGIKFQTSFGGANLNVNDFHHQIRFGIWNETVHIWNSKWREVLHSLLRCFQRF